MNPSHDPVSAIAGGRLIAYVEGRESSERIFRTLYARQTSRIEFKGLGSGAVFGNMAAEIKTISPDQKCVFLPDRDYRADSDCQPKDRLIYLPCHELENLLLDPKAITFLSEISEEQVRKELCHQAERYRFLAATEALLEQEIKRALSTSELGKNPDLFKPDARLWAKWVIENTKVEEGVLKDVNILADKIESYAGSFSPFTWEGSWKQRMPGKEILSGAKQTWEKVKGLPDQEFSERIAEALASSLDSQGYPNSESLAQMNSLITSLLDA